MRGAGPGRRSDSSSGHVPKIERLSNLDPLANGQPCDRAVCLPRFSISRTTDWSLESTDNAGTRAKSIRRRRRPIDTEEIGNLGRPGVRNGGPSSIRVFRNAPVIASASIRSTLCRSSGWRALLEREPAYLGCPFPTSSEWTAALRATACLLMNSGGRALPINRAIGYRLSS